MLYLKLMKNNSIVRILSDGKPVLNSSNGLYYHNSNELLCAAVGSCLGKQMVKYGNQYNINVELFESISINMNDDEIIINIQHPKNIDKEYLDKIQDCEIKSKINIPIEFNFNENDKNEKIKPCCGDK